MPNKNYLAGRRLEYDLMRLYEERGFSTLRTAGSHGAFDVIAYDEKRKPVFIQCKRVANQATAKRMGKVYESSVSPSLYYHQCLAIRVKGISAPIEVII